MSVLKKNRFKIVCGSFLLAGSILLTIINMIANKGVKITEWNNFYNENNIVFFYEELPDEKIELLNLTYKIQEKIADSDTELDKVIKAIDLAKSISTIDIMDNTGLNNGYDILDRNRHSSKSSFKDFAIISRDFINSLGITSRIGVFRKGNTEHHSDIEYYVLEYWSTEYNKWVMVDVKYGGYFEYNNEKLSSVEVINSDMNKVSYIGNTSQHDYKKNIVKYFDSYSVAIENSAQKKRSNCNVTYVKNDSAVEYKIKDSFAPPTVFTKETKLFEKSPFDKLVGTDEKAYILVCGAISNTQDKPEENKKVEEKNSKENSVLIAAFKEDKVLKSFYLNVNGQGYEEVDENKEIELRKGENIFELSLDGQNTMSSVTIEKR